MSGFMLPFALFLGGLASGVHCAGMCGGISAGFSLLKKERLLKSQLAFNAGRITSYAAAGAAAGTLGSAGAYMAAVLPAQIFLYFSSSAFVLLAGLQLWGAALPLSPLERIGLPLWRRLQPLAVALLRRGSFAGGLVWGWLPCGLVYGALLAAAFAGGPAQGAVAMAAFGAGTLPWLLAAGVLAARFRGALKLRRAGALLLIGFGAWGLAHGVEQTILCL
ncbi:MAG TPA: sulfite exporter TauE/SafE family protein [Burkholderiales bacterium]|nr:sulfite exporter TauE/SafE family protein [Burkholderiales bacterium]